MFGLYSTPCGVKERKSPDLLKSEAPGVAKTNGELPAATGLQLQDGCEKSHFPDKVHITAGAMDVTEEHNKKREKKEKQRWRNRVSLSASLPDDVCGVFAGSACLVKYSTDPIFDMRESILEMIRYEGVCDWNDMEELVYCYVALNPSEVHEIVREAFLSLCSN